MVTVKKFASRVELTRARRLAGLTMTRLARNLRVTTSAVSAWEAGTRKPSDSMIPDLAEELDVAPATLLDWIDNPGAAVACAGPT
jgi:transcriptional regulator with XRE-family HTH domain